MSRGGKSLPSPLMHRDRVSLVCLRWARLWKLLTLVVFILALIALGTFGVIKTFKQVIRSRSGELVEAEGGGGYRGCCQGIGRSPREAVTPGLRAGASYPALSRGVASICSLASLVCSCVP